MYLEWEGDLYEYVPRGTFRDGVIWWVIQDASWWSNYPLIDYVTEFLKLREHLAILHCIDLRLVGFGHKKSIA